VIFFPGQVVKNPDSAGESGMDGHLSVRVSEFVSLSRWSVS